MSGIYATDQQSMIRKIEQYCAAILDNIAAAKLLRQEAIDKGYAPGTLTTGIVDSDVQTISPACTAADITNALAAINSLDTTLAASSRQLYTQLEKVRPS